MHGETDDAKDPLFAAMPPDVVNEDAAHQTRGDREKVRAVLPVDLALIDQFEVGLIDQHRRVQRIAGVRRRDNARR